MWSVVVVSLALAATSACTHKSPAINAGGTSSARPIVQDKFDVDEFNRNKEKWLNAGVRDYRIILRANGFLINFPNTVTVTVKNGKMVSIVSGDPQNDYTKGYDFLNTVEKLFNFIDDRSRGGAEVLRVKYDEEFGFPTSIVLDEKKDWSDDELSVSTILFEPTHREL